MNLVIYKVWRWEDDSNPLHHVARVEFRNGHVHGTFEILRLLPRGKGTVGTRFEVCVNNHVGCPRPSQMQVGVTAKFGYQGQKERTGIWLLYKRGRGGRKVEV